MNTKLAILAATLITAGQAPAEALRRLHRRAYGTRREAGNEILQVVVIAAIIIVAIVTIFGPQLTALMEGWFNKIPK